MRPGEPNYITPAGARRLQEELIELRTKKRPKICQEVADAAAQGDRSENAEYIYGKKKLREIDRRIHFLVKRLDVATVVEPSERPEGERDRVFFGATIDVEDEDGKTATYQIVGEDEIDTARGKISYKCPLARALWKRREGETIVFKKPAGEVELTIVAIRWV
jgi:transcription elongation factor GreB